MGINSSVKQYLNTIVVKLYSSKGCCDPVASIETWLLFFVYNYTKHSFFFKFLFAITDEAIDETIFEVFAVVC